MTGRRAPSSSASSESAASGSVLDGRLQSFAFEAVAGTLIVLLALTFLVDLAGARVRSAPR